MNQRETSARRVPARPDAGPLPSVARSWEQQPWALRILRAFLGVTFVYAGVQKFLDPNFLHAGTPEYIGDQLRSFAAGSPIAPLLHLLGHVSLLAGIGIAVLEIAIGLGTLLGIAPITWAVAGLAVNTMLFLSASWHVHPYFLGSDSIYAVAWAAFLVGLVELRQRVEAEARLARRHGSRRQRAVAEMDESRRRFLRGVLVGGGALAVGMITSTIAGKPARAVTPSSAGGAPSTSRHPAGGGSGNATAPPPTGTTIASLDSMPVGGAVAFDDPAQGPAVLCRLSQTKVAAFSRICTHAGCEVEYDQQARLLVCPCHGAEFDPARGAAPVSGPAQIPLPRIPVAVDRSSGEVVARS